MAAHREISTDRYSYVFSPYAEPIASVRPGETVTIVTEDAFESRITSPDDLPSQVLNFPFLNPQTGEKMAVACDIKGFRRAFARTLAARDQDGVVVMKAVHRHDTGSGAQFGHDRFGQG